MKRTIRICMAQINTTVGDFAGNQKKIIAAIKEARALGVDIITFPELAVCGYPPEDLLFKPKFIERNKVSLQQIIEETAGLVTIIGFVDARQDIYDAAAVVYDKNVISVYHKIYLPNYGVFDENRYFKAGSECPVYDLNDIQFGVTICEDIWYATGPVSAQAFAGAELILNISASPYHYGKGEFRERMIRTRAADNIVIVAYNNLVGGQDELVFDGNSLISDEKGELLIRGKQFDEDLLITDIDVESVSRTRLHDTRWRKERLSERPEWTMRRFQIPDFELHQPKRDLKITQNEKMELLEEIYNALVLGTHDYVSKNGFQKVLLGLSGGIDSSLVAAIAVDALGPSNVIGVAMPSRYSSVESISDARQLSFNLGIKLLNIPIDPIFQSYLDVLADTFSDVPHDITEENIQARVRGNILMALSNKFGWLVLNTGNKSETATGFTTLYGDMSGGFAVIKDIPKTMVYQLVKYRNSMTKSEIIPQAIILKEPSAELRPEQRDVDSLPSYDVLDPILEAYVEADKSVDQIVDLGFDIEIVKRSIKLVDNSEYKRRQSPPGIKITPRAFGRDRRLPITNRFKI